MRRNAPESELSPKPTLMTQATFQRMRERQQKFEAERKEVTGGMREAAGRIGQWHDSFAYEQAQRDADLLARQIFDIREKLKNVEFIKPRQETDKVGIGNAVRLRYRDGEEEEITILGPNDYNYGDNPSWFPYTSPLAQAIMGHGKEESVGYQAAEKEFEVTILDIKPGEFE